MHIYAQVKAKQANHAKQGNRLVISPTFPLNAFFMHYFECPTIQIFVESKLLSTLIHSHRKSFSF